MSKKRVICHHCGTKKASQFGGDLACSPNCRERYAAAQDAAKQQMGASGFVKHATIANVWAKDGMHLSIDQVIREGFEQSIARHAEAVRGNR